MVRDKFAGKQETEGWFSQVLQELKHDYALPVAKRLGIEVYSYAEDVETN